MSTTIPDDGEEQTATAELPTEREGSETSSLIYEATGQSLPQKILLQALQTILLVAGLVILWRGPVEVTRRLLLAVAFLIVYLRLTLTVFHLLKRSIGWQEAASIPFAFALYYIGFALLAGTSRGPVGFVGFIGAGLFVAGSLINTGSEVLRDRWKSDPANEGRLYTAGLFRFAVHVNYFGDIVWVLGLALMTRVVWSLLIPAALFCFFAFLNAPMLDSHLEQHYGEAFRAYAARTAKIIPFVY